MWVPTDITTLIFGYLVKSSYKLEPWAEVYNLETSLEYSCSNPRALNWTKTQLKQKLSTRPINNPELNKIISGLCSNPNIDSIEILETINPSYIVSDINLIIKLLKRQEASGLVLKLFKHSPQIFKSYKILNNIGSCPGGELLIKLNYSESGLYISHDNLSYNSSDIALDKFCSLAIDYTTNVYSGLSLNKNPRALQLLKSSPIGKEIFGQTTQKNKPRNFSQNILFFTILESLARNPSAEAIELIKRIFNSNNVSADMRRMYLMVSSMAANPLDTSIDFIKENIQIFDDIDEILIYLVSNPNPRAFELCVQLLAEDDWVTLSNFLASNPAAINLIRSNPDIFLKIGRTCANPGLFSPVPNYRLIKKLMNKI